MDTQTAMEESKALLGQLSLIKTRMPNVYEAIQAKAGEIGRQAFGLVRRGLKGEPNTFYAFERGHVVGTPFSHGAMPPEVAQMMVQFGCAFVCIWAAPGAVAHPDAAQGGT